MTLAQTVVKSTIIGISNVLCRVDTRELVQVPTSGPLIIVANHVNFMDMPVLFSHLYPRPFSGLVKAETWDNPVLGWLFSLGNGTPVRRGEGDIRAIRAMLQALDRKRIVGMAPEGHRSGHGRLQRGKPGVVLLALHSGAPILPIVYSGLELFYQNISRLRRTDFNIRVGTPFYLDSRGERVSSAVRQQMADEIMYQMAALLPSQNRGYYSDLSQVTTAYLRFAPGLLIKPEAPVA
jgi:1-acyl-sn-glycerol-3-phosphate acyltransferase